MVSLLFFFDGVPAMFGLIAMIQQCLREEGRLSSTTAKSFDYVYNNLHMGVIVPYHGKAWWGKVW